jgi:hypothetical protein
MEHRKEETQEGRNAGRKEGRTEQQEGRMYIRE